MNINPTYLYMQDNNGKVREWSIGVIDWTIIIRHGEKCGSMQEVTEEVFDGKASRTREDQILSRIASRISKQRDKGYSNSILDAYKKAVNALGLEKPMLATALKHVKNVDYKGAFVQRKYDGNRCLITKQKGNVIAYTRNGKIIGTIGHILDGLELWEGQTLDGELYCHGEALQTIVSWIKRKQENTLKLKYHVYDVISTMAYYNRYKMLQTIPLSDAMEIAPTEEVTCFEEVQEHFKESRKLGYEGSIVRLHTHGYEDGKRSRSLIKIKAWDDDDFKIFDITPSKDGWAILNLTAKNGKTFCVTCPGTVEHKHHVMDNMVKYLGKYVRVEYAQLTKDGIPFHPIATLIIHEDLL